MLQDKPIGQAHLAGREKSKKRKACNRLFIGLWICLFFLSCGVVRAEEIRAQVPRQSILDEDAVAKRIDAIKKGINYLRTTSHPFTNGASSILPVINERCQKEELHKLWKEKYPVDFENMPYLLRLMKNMEITPDFKPEWLAPRLSVEDKTGLGSPYSTDVLLIKASHCESFSFEEIEQDISNLGLDGGYISTHVFIAYLWLLEQGCYDAALIKDKLKTLSGHLIDAQRQDETGEGGTITCDKITVDLYAERSAVLGYAGFTVEDKWVDNLIACQQPDGSWLDPHSTVFSILAIIESVDRCE